MSTVISKINSLNINIVLKNTPVSQKGFSQPLILGVKAPTYFLKVLSGLAGLKWSAATAGVQYIRIVYAVSGNNTALAVARTGTGVEGDPYIITVTVATNGSGAPTSTAAQVKAAAEAVANVAGESKIVNVALLESPGSGAVSAFASAPLEYERYMEITDSDELLGLGFANSDLEYKSAVAMFSQNPRPSIVSVFLLTAWDQVEVEIAALRNKGKDAWYKVVPTSYDKTVLHSLGDYFASIEKLMFATTDDITVLVGRDNSREFYILTSNPGNMPHSRIVGASSPLAIGTYNYAYLALEGVENSGFTNSQVSSILSDSGNYIGEFGGKNVLYDGKATSGVYIDNVENRDWLKAKLTERSQLLFTSAVKVPFTLGGLSMAESALREVFSEGGRQTIIAPVESEDDKKRSDLGEYQYILKFPASIDEIPENDRSNRKLGSVKFSVRTSGAINDLDISGELT